MEILCPPEGAYKQTYALVVEVAVAKRWLRARRAKR